jgi:hypothetical protein
LDIPVSVSPAKQGCSEEHDRNGIARETLDLIAHRLGASRINEFNRVLPGTGGVSLPHRLLKGEHGDRRSPESGNRARAHLKGI